MEYILNRITVDPDKCNGKPVIRDTRLTVQTVLEFLGAGEDEKEILRQYPFLEPDDIRASIKFAVELMNNNYSLKATA